MVNSGLDGSALRAAWVCCQIGARENYAIPRMLQQEGNLERLCTDLWIPPSVPFLTDRWHPDLRSARVFAPNRQILTFELLQKLRRTGEWERTMTRNEKFQDLTVAELRRSGPREATLFSYSYAAGKLFTHAKERGWRTVLGQIDPGPEEERLVQAEHRRYPQYGSSRQPPPESYWTDWKRETEMADQIVVNSQWSKECLLIEGVKPEKIRIVPLAYGSVVEGGKWKVEGDWWKVESGRWKKTVNLEGGGEKETFHLPPSTSRHTSNPSVARPGLKVLFLGQVNLRKGVARLVEAMRMLKDEPIELTLAGPCSLDPAAWADLPKVRWIGPVARRDTDAIYREADVFILPTISDGFALTQLEAMAHGLPVVATRRCGEVVSQGEDGWILEDAEPATIARTLTEAATVREWEPMREAARRKAERFRLETVGKLFREAVQ